jgi:hypothetical protein
MKARGLVVEPAHFGPFNLPKVKGLLIIHDLTPFFSLSIIFF